jgi:vacuolar-type H+-ATPase subunit I/STV1
MGEVVCHNSPQKLNLFAHLKHVKMSTPISVTQGLAELKLLDKRLSKGLIDLSWIAISTKTNRVLEDELQKSASSEYQSYMDLVKRRDIIKRAIVLSNAATNVTIGRTWTGTVAEAIEYKSSVQYKKKLLAAMKQNILSIEDEFKQLTDDLQSRLDRLLSSELGKDIKTNPETIASLTTSFQENNKILILDPLGLKGKVKALETEIDAFETNVDWVLSETNGKTMINV